MSSLSKKIKDLEYYVYDDMTGIGVAELKHAIGSDNPAYIEHIKRWEYFGNEPISLWFMSERDFLNFLLQAGYVKEKDIFIKCL